jgi:hypothetical protein
MSEDAVLSLAQSDDADFHEIALQRLLRKKSLTEQDEVLLREAIPHLSHDRLLELLARHGDLGAARKIVTLLVSEIPRDHREQMFYFRDWVLEMLPRALGADGYADLVEQLAPHLSPRIYPALLAHVRGCPTFTAIAAHDVGGGPPWARVFHQEPCGVYVPLVAGLLDVRPDERAIQARLEARIAGADLGMLLRLRWVLESANRGDLAALAWRRCLDLFPVVDDPEHPTTDEHGSLVRHYHWQLVLAWVNEPTPGRPDRLAWLADRLALLPHFSPTGHFPDDLTTDLGNLLIDRGQTPDWAASLLLQRLRGGSLDAWKTVFAWWRPGGLYRLAHDYTECKAMVMDAPLPAEAPDDFDQAFLDCAEDVRAFEREQIKGQRRWRGDAGPQIDLDKVHDDWGLELALAHQPGLDIQRFRPLVTTARLVERLLQMPLTQPRAARLARMMCGHRELIHHPRLLEVATASGPIGIEALPAFEDFERHGPVGVEIYRRLGGAAADERLREHLRRTFAEMRSEGKRFPWHWPCVPEIVDEDLRREMTSWASAASLREVLDLHRSAAWLAGEPMVEAAAQRQLDAGVRWDDWWFLERVAEEQPILRTFLEQRARRTDCDQELAAILAWLEKRGMPRRERLGIVLGHLEHRPPTPELAKAAAQVLSTRTAWEKDGAVLLRAIVRWSDWRALGEIWWTFVEKTDLEKLLTDVHLAFATVLLEMAIAAVEAGDHDRLVATLTAVLKLDPPPPIVRKLLDLRRRDGLPDRAVLRIEAGVKLFKSGEGRTPTIDGLYEAVEALSRAAGSTPSVLA